MELGGLNPSFFAAPYRKSHCKKKFDKISRDHYYKLEYRLSENTLVLVTLADVNPEGVQHDAEMHNMHNLSKTLWSGVEIYHLQCRAEICRLSYCLAANISVKKLQFINLLGRTL